MPEVDWGNVIENALDAILRTEIKERLEAAGHVLSDGLAKAREEYEAQGGGEEVQAIQAFNDACHRTRPAARAVGVNRGGARA